MTAMFGRRVVLRPLQAKTETLHVLPGSHAQEYARRRFPHKPVKEVTGGWQPPTKRPADNPLPHPL